MAFHPCCLANCRGVQRQRYSIMGRGDKGQESGSDGTDAIPIAVLVRESSNA
jgi:hypothetical protein